MRLSLRDNLPFINVTVMQAGQQVDILNVLVDTGSGGTIFSADSVQNIGITPRENDVIHHVYGVGGSEVVFMRRIDQILVGGYCRLKLAGWITVLKLVGF